MEYPAPFVVKNTFIDSLEGPAGLEGFLVERKIRSCPTSSVEESQQNRSSTSCADAFDFLRCLQEDSGSWGSLSTSTGHSTRANSGADSSSDEDCRSSARSTSFDHRMRTCNPCAHFHSANGCRKGSQCHYCHECPPGELKRRQKAKRRALQQASAAS